MDPTNSKRLYSSQSENLPTPKKNTKNTGYDQQITNPLLANVGKEPDHYIDRTAIPSPKPGLFPDSDYADAVIQSIKQTVDRMIDADLIIGQMEGSEEETAVDLVEKLGQGVSGTVWQGTLDKTRLQVSRNPTVDKQLDPDYQDPKTVALKQFKSQFDREIEIVKSLKKENIPGIPRLYGILISPDGNSHLVQKYCNAGPVRNFFNVNLSNKVACIEKVIELMKIVDSFHKTGYCHRDISEDNFLLHRKKDGSGETNYLADFGLAGKIQSPFKITTQLVQMRNSPREILLLYESAKITGDYSLYGNYVDKHGFEIDAYQFGMMLLRLATTQGNKLPLIKEHPEQLALVKEIDSSLLQAGHPPDFFNYMDTHHEDIPPKLRHLIAGLLSGTSNLQEAIVQLTKFVS